MMMMTSFPTIVVTGAYGAAVLYKKKDDDSLVILKEINMHDLKASERQMALNEVLLPPQLLDLLHKLFRINCRY